MRPPATSSFSASGAEGRKSRRCSAAASDVGAVLEGLLWHEGVRRPHAPVPPPPEEIEPDRTDLRDLFAFTIDPDEAKDFDDALELPPRGGRRSRLGPHRRRERLRPGRLAARPGRGRPRLLRRTCPGRVEPMLPELLSADLCSLRPRPGPPLRDCRGALRRRPLARRAALLPQRHQKPRAPHLLARPGDPGRRRARARGDDRGASPRRARRDGASAQALRAGGAQDRGGGDGVRVRRRRWSRAGLDRGRAARALARRGDDDPRERGGRRAARRAQARGALPGARAARSRSRSSSSSPSSPSSRCRRHPSPSS